MGKENLSKVAKSVTTGLKKRSPEILTGIGIVGMVSATVLAVRSTPRALELIEDEKRKRNRELIDEAKELGLDNCERLEKLKPVEVVKTTWKCYIPAAITGAMSIMCLVGASTVNARRNAALAAAYTLTETTLKEYRQKVVDTIGDKKEKVVREAISKDHIDKDPVGDKEIIFTDKGDTLCYDVLSGRYFKSDVDKLNKAVNEINRRMINNTYISLNEFYYEIGLSGTKLGNDLGWRIDQGTLELDFSAQLASDGTPCLVMDYLKTPEYNFDRWL